MRMFAFHEVPHDRKLCFDVLNFAEALAADPLAIEKLETQLSGQGAMPGHVDMPTNTICVLVTDPALTDDDVTRLITNYGFVVRLRKGESS